MNVTKKVPQKKVDGRPTKYKPEYCQLLIEHMSKGYSYETFGAYVDVSKQTVYDWEKKNPEFLDAKEIAFEKCRLFWEGLGINHVLNESETEKDQGYSRSRSTSLNASVWIFNMKNRFKWTDRMEVTPQDPGDKRELAHLTDDQLKKLSE